MGNSTSYDDPKNQSFVGSDDVVEGSSDGRIENIHDNRDHLHRRLGNREIQLIAVGGSIGTALFVSIGGALLHGGPGSLFLGFSCYAVFMSMINNSIAEMITYMPVSGGFIRLAGHWCDDAFGFMAGWNFYNLTLLIPYEITALNIVLSYWSDHIPVAAICAAAVVLYVILNVIAVRAYGEAEFYLSSGKVILIVVLYFFTFITMVGGNPQHDAYGFRYWQNPGAFAAYLHSGALGRFEGFLNAIWTASFTIVGPEYLSMIAAEARLPGTYIRNAYKTMYIRFALFFVGTALACGVVIAYNDPSLVSVVTGNSSASGTAGASPFVIAMSNMHIDGLPHFVNALLVTSIFSAGNTYTYCASRSLYGLALEGRAPRFLTKCTKNGVPIWCVLTTCAFGLLSFLSVSNASNIVLTWLSNLVTAGGLINFIVMGITYISFYQACKVQGLDRRTLPYRARFQPYSAWIGTIFETCVVFCYGYPSFLPWDVASFFQYYAMLFLAVVTFGGWKLIKRTKFKTAAERDLVWERPYIDAYEAKSTDKPVGFWHEMLVWMRLKRPPKVDSKESQNTS